MTTVSQILGVSKAAGGAEELSALGLVIGREEYGIRMEVVEEVVARPRITRVPRAPRHIRGVMNLRGNVVPVIDLAARLGVGTTSLKDGYRAVAVRSGGELVCLLAEEVSRLRRVAMADVKPPPASSGIDRRFVEGITRLSDRFLILLDLSKVLGDDDDAASV